MRFDIETESDRKKKNSNKEKQKIYIILILFFSLLSIILIISFVSSNSNKKAEIADPTPQEPTLITPSPATTNKPTKNEINIVDENSDERPIAVMIDNYIGDAKHAGLQDSYLNYEILVEGGITRIMAIYKDKDVSLIGPVRSARHYFLDYAAESDAIYAHYGWSPYTRNDIEKLNIDNIDGLSVSEVYRRDTNSIAPHNVFTRMSYLRKYIEKSTYSDSSDDWELLNYSPEQVDLEDTDYTPKDADKIVIPYSTSEVRAYTYDDSKGYYLRYNNGSPQLDRKSGKQLHYKNIIIQRVPTKVIDNEGRIDLETTGKGRAYFITNGKFLPITWTKSSRTAKTKYKYENGTTVEVNDGNTFIQIVPENCDLSIE